MTIRKAPKRQAFKQVWIILVTLYRYNTHGRKIMNTQDTVELIKNGGLDSTFTRLYGERAVSDQRKRYICAIENFCALYGADRDISLFSVPGRSEISGNHTDHNRGCVIAASIDLDIIAVASKTDSALINIKSEGHRADSVDINEFTAPKENLYGRSCSIIAGVVSGFRADGLSVGGFDAYTTSCVRAARDFPRQRPLKIW